MTTYDEERAPRVESESMIAAARLDGPPEGLTARVIGAVVAGRTRAKRNRALLTAGALIAAAGVLFAIRSPLAEPEPAHTVESRIAREAAPVDSTPTLLRPCQTPVVARGTHPMIDDFEHRTPDVPRLDGRRGHWQYVNDRSKDPQPYSTTLLPTSDRTPQNQRGVHLREGLLRDWGASLEYVFDPDRCYDASEYAGVRFRAKGPLRVKVGARQIDEIPVEYGGLCEGECWIVHLAAVQLGEGWQTVELPWAELRRRGYDSKPLDPSRLHSLQIQIESEDSPFELWVDDFGFLPHEKRDLETPPRGHSAP